MARQRVVKVSDEPVAVFHVEGHERAAHQDKLYLICRMPELLQLIHAALCLEEGVVARADCAHACRLVPCVRLGRVLEVGVGATRAVDADTTGHGDVRAAVRLRHDCHHRDTRRRADRLSL